MSTDSMPNARVEEGDFTSTSPYVTNITVALFEADLVYGVICVACLTGGTVLNLLSLLFFIIKTINSKENRVGTILYACIACCDLFICILAGIIGISYMSSRKPALLGNGLLCNTWGVLWNIFPRMSVLLVALLSVTRAKAVYRPLSKLKTKCIFKIMACYWLLQVSQALLPYFVGARYQYSTVIVICFWQITDLAKYGSLGYYFLWLFLLMLQFALPVFPILGSSIFCIYQLCKKDTVSRRYASITVIIVTAVYVLFNLPLALYLMIGFAGEVTRYRVNIFRFDSQHMLLGNFLMNISVACNALINPCIYFCRVSDMRVWLRAMVVRISLYFKRNSEPSPSTLQLDHVNID